MTKTIHRTGSTFSVVERPGFVCIIDHNEGRSVTNDAEKVIACLISERYDLSANRVIYRDTRGIWNEMLVERGAFAGFRPVNAPDLDAAIAMSGRK